MGITGIFKSVANFIVTTVPNIVEGITDFAGTNPRITPEELAELKKELSQFCDELNVVLPGQTQMHSAGNPCFTSLKMSDDGMTIIFAVGKDEAVADKMTLRKDGSFKHERWSVGLDKKSRPFRKIEYSNSHDARVGFSQIISGFFYKKEPILSAGYPKQEQAKTAAPSPLGYAA